MFPNTSKDLILAIHVDDGLVISKDTRKINKVVDNLSRELEITANSLNMCLGIQFERMQDGSILAHQSLYTMKLLENFKVEEANPVAIPADKHQYLSQFVPNKGIGEPTTAPYRKAVGSLLYLALMT